MFDYREIFDQRGELYNRATLLCPSARDAERRLVIDRLRVEPAAVVCDLPAGGGYVADGIAEIYGDRNPVICVEPSEVFAGMIAGRFRTVISPLEDIALPGRSVGAAVSLAGLHHLPSKAAFFSEAARILQPGGRISVADALHDTPTAYFLNGPVDRLCETGHNGVFLEKGELSYLLESAGFVDVEEEHCEYTWDFPSPEILSQYCTGLFGLTKARRGEVWRVITYALGVFPSDHGVHMAWSLVFASGTLRSGT